MEIMENLKNSSMRIALIWGMILLTSIFAGITYRLVTDETVDYSGIAILLGAATIFIGALVTGKYFQKKVEVKSS